MTELNILKELQEVLQGTANVAGRVKNKIAVFALIGLAASAYIAWLLYSAESSLGWNTVKCGFVLLPAIVMCFFWLTLAKVADAPKQLSEITNDDGLVRGLDSIGLKKPDSLSGLISTVRSIRNEESLASIVEAIGGIALLANPAFLFVTFICIAILLLLIIVAPFVFIF